VDVVGVDVVGEGVADKDGVLADRVDEPLDGLVKVGLADAGREHGLDGVPRSALVRGLVGGLVVGVGVRLGDGGRHDADASAGLPS
jgi:hypothetical protein